MLVPGMVYSHEHIPIDLSEVKKNEDCLLDCESLIVEEFKDLYNLGVRNIVDMTNNGMGRNISYVQRVEAASGINIVSATGYYQDAFLPREVFNMSVTQLADKMINEICVGVKGTDVKAGVIGEIATTKDVWTPAEEKVFKAAVIAQRETNVPISTHTSIGTLGHEQVHFFERNHTDLSKIVIGHVDLTGDVNYIIEMLKTGINVEFDTIGKENYMPELTRINMLRTIVSEGLQNQIVLSMDITRKSMLKNNGGKGYSYLLEKFVPLMKENGISEESINKMLVDNPQRIFGR